MGVIIPGVRLHLCDDRLSPLGQAGRGHSKALPGPKSVGRREPSAPSGHQHRQACRLPASHRTTQSRGRSGENCRHRPVQYLNNVLEQDHRAIKRRVRASQHFRSFWGAWRTIAGYEAIHMIRKGQACGVRRVRRSVYCTASFSICSLRRAKLPIIYPGLWLDYKVATHPVLLCQSSESSTGQISLWSCCLSFSCVSLFSRDRFAV